MSNVMKSKGRQRRGSGLRLEALEPRTLLTVIAHDDTYGVTEDTPNTAPVTVIPQYSGLWRVNDELLRSVNQYPTDAAGRHWAERDFDTSTSRIGASPSLWDSSLPGPFVGGDSVNAFHDVPKTIVHAPSETETTFLLRRTFLLDAVLAEAVWGRITYTCDSGCIMYINGVRAASSPNMAGILSPTPNTFAGTEGDEDPPHDTALFNLNGSVQPTLYEGVNVLAVEVHNGAVTSADIGGDFSLAIAPQGGSVLTNDDFAAQFGRVALAKVSDPVDDATGDPAGTIALNTDIESPDFGTFAYAPATNYCGMASWAYEMDDGHQTPSRGVVRLGVACVNDPPAAHDDAYAVRIGAELQATPAVGLLANDTDAEDDSMIAQIIDADAVTAQGDLNVDADGSFTFHPFPTAMPGAYRLTYRVVDSGAPSAMSNVAIAEITITSGCAENADLDQNGQVGRADFAILVENFGSPSATPDQGDLDCDGKIGLTDLAALKRGWTPQTASAAASSIVQSDGLRVDQTRHLSATRTNGVRQAALAADYRQAPLENGGTDAPPSQQHVAMRLRAVIRALIRPRRGIDAAFSDM